MARFVTGNTFGTTDTVTAAKLNTAVNDAAISTDSVDGSTIEINSNALRIKDSGVTFAKLTDVIDDDTMATASSTKIATSESIKAYVDNLETNPVNLTLLNDTVAFGGDYEVPSYYRTKDNIVHLRGLMKDSTTNPIATLPSGFRPAKRLLFATYQDEGTTDTEGRVDILANGNIDIVAGNVTFNSLDGVSFLADGS
jgi:hypothetical protein